MEKLKSEEVANMMKKSSSIVYEKWKSGKAKTEIKQNQGWELGIFFPRFLKFGDFNFALVMKNSSWGIIRNWGFFGDIGFWGKIVKFLTKNIENSTKP